MAIAYIEKHGETNTIALAQPQPACQAPDPLHFPDLHVLIVDNKIGEKPATCNLKPPTHNQQPSGPLSNHSRIGPDTPPWP